MLQRMLNPRRPVPWQMLDGDLRQVVMILPILHKQALALIQPAHDPSGETWIPPQGGIGPGESIFEAERRETREEIRSFRRENPRGPLRALWPQARYLGSAENLGARSGRPSLVHAVALPVVYPKLDVNPKECRAGIWAYDPAAVDAMLESTLRANPGKYDIVAAALVEAARRDMIH